MIAFVVVAIAAWLVGGIPFSYIAGRLTAGIDLREHGSGNLGATNTFRILGPRVAIVVLVCDVAKGVVPVLMAPRAAVLGGADASAHALALTAMFFAILGHMFSPYLRFSGGKGIATSAGAFAALEPRAFLGAFVVFWLVFAARRIVSLASLSAAVSLPVFVWIVGRTGLGPAHRSTLVVSLAIMLVVIYRHRENIRRLRAGTEPRLARTRRPS